MQGNKLQQLLVCKETEGEEMKNKAKRNRLRHENLQLKRRFAELLLAKKKNRAGKIIVDLLTPAEKTCGVQVNIEADLCVKEIAFVFSLNREYAWPECVIKIRHALIHCVVLLSDVFRGEKGTIYIYELFPLEEGEF